MAILFPKGLSKGLTGLLFGASTLGKGATEERRQLSFSSAV